MSEKKMSAAEKQIARALVDHLTERDEEQGCSLRCGYHGDDRAQHLAEVVLASPAVDLIRADALREAAELADVGHGAGCEANPDGDCLGCFREDLLRLATRIDGREPEEQ